MMAYVLEFQVETVALNAFAVPLLKAIYVKLQVSISKMNKHF